MNLGWYAVAGFLTWAWLFVCIGEAGIAHRERPRQISR